MAMNEPVRNAYQLDSGWRVGVLMSDGIIAFNPESPLYSEREARNIAEARHADRPFLRFVAVEAATAAVNESFTTERALGGGDAG